MEDVGELYRAVETRCHKRRHLDIDEIAEAKGESPVTVLPLARRSLDAGHLSEKRAEQCRRTAKLSTDHAAERGRLLRRCRGIQHNSDLPTAVRHHRRTVDNERECQSA